MQVLVLLGQDFETLYKIYVQLFKENVIMKSE